jgi:sigma-B regulation protein RsbU (phosphoserine phosphatase)
MYATQKATFLSNQLKFLLDDKGQIKCTVSLIENSVHELCLNVRLITFDDNEEIVLEKYSWSNLFDPNQLDTVKRIFDVKTIDELLVDIQSKNEELESSLKNLRIAKDQNARMESELEVGQSIQMGMLPKESYTSENVELFAKLIPAREVGGDFYDFFEVDSKRLGIVMGDVSGKGVPAALMMAVCKTLLKAEAIGRTSAAEVITRVNNTMAAENKNYMFVTIFMGILNTQTGELTYTNAGHCPTYVSRVDGSVEKLSEVHGPAVAAMEGISFREAKIKISSGDKIIAYTDGIPEAHDVDKNLYGDDRLENLIRGNDAGPELLANNIIQSVIEYEKGTERFDDLTVLCLEFNKSSNQNKIISVKYDVASLAVSLNEVENYLTENGVGLGFVSKVQIALDEVISNIIKYSTSEESDKIISLEVSLSNSSINLRVKDSGVAFNPIEKETPNTDLGIEDRKVGGLGIHITKNIMSDIQYDRVNDENILTLKLDYN